MIRIAGITCLLIALVLAGIAAFAAVKIKAITLIREIRMQTGSKTLHIRYTAPATAGGESRRLGKAAWKRTEGHSVIDETSFLDDENASRPVWQTTVLEDEYESEMPDSKEEKHYETEILEEERYSTDILEDEGYSTDILRDDAYQTDILRDDDVYSTDILKDE